VHGANPAYGLPDSVDFAAAMDKVGKVVSFSSFMDETTAKADLVLPDHVYLESWGDDVPEPGPGYETITFQQPVVYPFQSETRPYGDVLLEVAQNLGGEAAADLPWTDMKDALRATAQRLQSFGRGSVRSGSFDAFWNTSLQRGGWWDVNARSAAPAPNPPSLSTERLAPTIEGPTGTDTFNLVPFSTISLGDGKGANLSWLQATPDPLTTAAWHTWAEINPQVARDMDIKEGDVLELEGPGGRKITALAYPHPAAAPGVISVPTGQGHTVYGDYEIGPDLHRVKVAAERGSNVLSMLSPLKDGETGALAWAATRVSVKKTGDFVRLSKLEGVVLPILPEEIIPIAGLE
jgi:anaerobic selenocysteine-containing dehydrogenase